jgi:hypothetical protein
VWMSRVMTELSKAAVGGGEGGGIVGCMGGKVDKF